MDLPLANTITFGDTDTRLREAITTLRGTEPAGQGATDATSATVKNEKHLAPAWLFC